MRVAFDGGEEILRLAVPLRRHSGSPSMRAGPDADIILVAPVSEVVAAFLPGGGVVADFVGGKAGGLHPRLGQLIQISRCIIVEWLPLPFGDIGGEAGAGFDGQLVERHVRGAKADGARQFGIPGRSRLVGSGIDQVDADPPEMPLCGFERGEAFIHPVRAAQKFEHLIIKRLQTERHPVYSSRRQLCKTCRLDRGGVGLKGDLDIIREPPMPLCRIDQRSSCFGWHQ